MNKNPDRREFERFPMDFVLEVSSRNVDGKKLEDTVVSKEFSGQGATFLTQKADIYFPGQILELSVLLPETDKMQLCMMKTIATVIRIEPLKDSMNAYEKSDCTIAVEFKAGLKFERIDKKPRELSNNF
jgi:hypothetical protein